MILHFHILISKYTDLIWLQKRVKSIKPVIRSLISEPKLMGDEVVFYIQGVDDELEVLFDVRMKYIYTYAYVARVCACTPNLCHSNCYEWILSS